MSRHTTRRLSAAVIVLALGLTACGGDDPAADVAADAEDVVEDTTDETVEDSADDIEQAAEDAEDVLEDAGVDADAGGSAQVALGTEMFTVPADGGFGCFVSQDGGSNGAISFDGTDEAGNSVNVDWAGDSPDSQSVSITTADGTEYQTPFGVQLDVVLDETSASANGKIVALADGSETDFFVTVECG